MNTMERLRLRGGRLLAGVVILLGLMMSSCVGGDVYWGNAPDGYDYNDTRLGGYWQLVQANSDPVSVNQSNWLYFNGSGYGYYYYFANGYRQTERLRYWSQPSGNGASNWQINIQYEYDSPVTQSYWFTHGGNTLWLQWMTGNGRVVTYVYDRVNGAPW